MLKTSCGGGFWKKNDVPYVKVMLVLLTISFDNLDLIGDNI